MAGNEFTFKQFKVRQERCAMKVGTDGVLLGAWAEGGKRILDVGTGTGLIALMMAQRYSKACIVALDVDHEACMQACENADASPYGERIEVVETAVQQFAPPVKFDCIVTNPPYFERSLRNPDSRRALARHSDALPFGDLFASARRLLAPGGVLSAVIPVEAESSFTAEASLCGFSLTRRLAIRTTPRKAPRRLLVAFVQGAATACERSEAILQNADGSRSEWYAELTKEFYIR